jgi:hypothetical protein
MRRVWPLISQAALASQASGALGIAGVSEAGRLAMAPRLTDEPLLLSRLSASFVGRASRLMDGAPESASPCWLAVAAVHPLGDCD